MDFPQARSSKKQRRCGFDSLASPIAPSEMDCESKSSNWKNSILLVYSSFMSILVILLVYNIAMPNKVQASSCSKDENTLEQSFVSDRRFMTLDHQYDHLWDVPGDDARVKITDPVIAGQELFAGIGMFHELHCLASMRKALQAARAGDDIAFDWRGNNHWPHCLDYLRKVIICRADDTLEIPRLQNGSRLGFIDGSGFTRHCRSTQSLYAMSGAQLPE